MLASAVSQIGFLLLVGVTVLGVSTRDRWIRLSVLLHVTNWVLVALFQDRGHPAFAPTNFTIDSVGAMLAIVIATRAEAAWAAAVAAFQCLGLLARLAPFLDPEIHRRAVITSLYVWETGTLTALSAGAMKARLRRRAVAMLKAAGSASVIAAHSS